MSIPAFVAAAADLLAQIPPTTGPTSRPAAPPLLQFIQQSGLLLPVAIILMLFMVMSSRSRKKT